MACSSGWCDQGGDFGRRAAACRGCRRARFGFEGCDLFPGIDYRGNGLDQTLPKTEIKQIDIRIHAEL